MTSARPNTLTLACWNIHRGVGTDNVKSMERLAESDHNLIVITFRLS